MKRCASRIPISFRLDSKARREALRNLALSIWETPDCEHFEHVVIKSPSHAGPFDRRPHVTLKMKTVRQIVERKTQTIHVYDKKEIDYEAFKLFEERKDLTEEELAEKKQRKKEKERQRKEEERKKKEEEERKKKEEEEEKKREERKKKEDREKFPQIRLSCFIEDVAIRRALRALAFVIWKTPDCKKFRDIAIKSLNCTSRTDAEPRVTLQMKTARQIVEGKSQTVRVYGGKGIAYEAFKLYSERKDDEEEDSSDVD